MIILFDGPLAIAVGNVARVLVLLLAASVFYLCLQQWRGRTRTLDGPGTGERLLGGGLLTLSVSLLSVERLGEPVSILLPLNVVALVVFTHGIHRGLRSGPSTRRRGG